MIHIQLAPEIEAQLAAEAQARGIALERYIVEKLSGTTTTEHSQQCSAGEAVDNIRLLRKGNRLEGTTVKSLIREGIKH